MTNQRRRDMDIPYRLWKLLVRDSKQLPKQTTPQGFKKPPQPMLDRRTRDPNLLIKAINELNSRVTELERQFIYDDKLR